MAAADTARLIASLELKDQFTPGLAKANRALGGFDARLAKTEGRAYKAGQQIGTGIKNSAKLVTVGVGLLATQVALGLNSLIKLEQAQAQTAAVLKSTGQVAGITAEQVGTLAEKYESYNATVGDETIRETENLLLTFTNVRKKAFEPALAAILDMNTAMGKGPEGLTSTAIQVGKALNDPTKGLTALRKVGVAFTDAQVDQIKALQKSGDLLGAQEIIIRELNKEFGGSFLAQGDTTAGKVAKFTDSIEDLQRSLATALLPAIGNVADELSKFLQDPAVIRGASELGEQIGELFSRENVSKGIGAMREVFAFAKEVAPVVATAAQTMGQVIGTAVGLFKSLPPEIQNLAVAGLAVNKLTGGLVTNIAGGLISSVLKQLVSGVVNVNGGVVNVTGPGIPGGTPGATPPSGGGIGGAVRSAAKAAAVVLAPVSVLEIGSAVAGSQRDSTNRIVNSQGNIARTVADGNQRIAIVRDSIAKLEVRAADGDAMAQRQLEGQRTLLADLIGNTKQVKTSTIEAGVKAKNASMETKAQVASSAMIQQALLLGQMATTRVAASQTQGAIRGVAPPIVSALRSLPTPITTVTVNVSATHVTKSTTVQNRYGPGNGSSGQNARPGDSGV